MLQDDSNQDNIHSNQFSSEIFNASTKSFMSRTDYNNENVAFEDD